MELAVVAKAPVIAIPDEAKEAEYKSVPLTVVTPEQQVKPYEAPVVVQKAPEPAPPVVVAEARPAEQLPKTASHVPLFAALGLLSLGGAFGLRILSEPGVVSSGVVEVAPSNRDRPLGPRRLAPRRSPRDDRQRPGRTRRVRSAPFPIWRRTRPRRRRAPRLQRCRRPTGRTRGSPPPILSSSAGSRSRESGVRAIVREGDDDATLAVAVGHIPGTAQPGARGNMALAGHRDSFFRGLRHIRVRDAIRIRTAGRLYEYRVDSTEVVAPGETRVLDPTCRRRPHARHVLSVRVLRARTEPVRRTRPARCWRRSSLSTVTTTLPCDSCAPASFAYSPSRVRRPARKRWRPARRSWRCGSTGTTSSTSTTRPPRRGRTAGSTPCTS